MSGSWVMRLLVAGVFAAVVLTVGAAAFVPAEAPSSSEVVSPTSPTASDASPPTTGRPAAASADAGVIDPGDLLEPFELPPTTQHPSPPSERVTGPPALESVQGIVVHERLAPFLRTLLAEAETAGVSLGGGGFRDRAAQRRLRQQNCPDPAASPPEACSPPTARVGESLHEYGLAIDFTTEDGLIVERDNPAYRFLEANSSWTGLVPHPAEPWHWSYRG